MKKSILPFGLLLGFIYAVTYAWENVPLFHAWWCMVIVAVIVASLFTFSVEEKEVGIIERWGKFVRLAHPGLNFKLPFIEKVRDKVSLKIIRHKIIVETKTKDDIFVEVSAAILRKINPDNVKDAYYATDNPDKQIKSYVLSAIRELGPTLILNDLYTAKKQLAESIKKNLKKMETVGFIIEEVLVTEIEPAEKVKKALAKMVRMIKLAEADAQVKKQEGIGIALEREAIVDGLKKAAKELKESLGEEISTETVMNMLLMTQYFDTIKQIGVDGNSNTIFLPASIAGLGDIGKEIFSANLITGAVKKNNEQAQQFEEKE